MNGFFLVWCNAYLKRFFSFVLAPEWLTKSSHITDSLTAFENKFVHFIFNMFFL